MRRLKKKNWFIGHTLADPEWLKQARLMSSWKLWFLRTYSVILSKKGSACERQRAQKANWKSAEISSCSVPAATW